MRVPAGRRLRVGPGDTAVATARLPGSTTLGRLHVFAREGADSEYSPFIPGLASMAVNTVPTMMAPLHMRLTSDRPVGKLTINSDIDGWMRIYQEVDNLKDARIKIKWKLKVSPNVPWYFRACRQIRGWMP